MKNLIFNGRVGYYPDPGTLESFFLAGCSSEDPQVWRYLSRLSKSEVDAIIEHLIHMGWGFEWVTIH